MTTRCFWDINTGERGRWKVFWVARRGQEVPFDPKATRACVRQQQQRGDWYKNSIIPPPRWYWGLLVTFRHKPIGGVTNMFKARWFNHKTDCRVSLRETDDRRLRWKVIKLSLPFFPSQAVIGRHSVPASATREARVSQECRLIDADWAEWRELVVPVWPFPAVASSQPAPGLCHVTEPSTSRSQLRSARTAGGRDKTPGSQRSSLNVSSQWKLVQTEMLHKFQFHEKETQCLMLWVWDLYNLSFGRFAFQRMIRN